MNHDYEALSLAELKVIAKDKGIKNISVLRKKELVEQLQNLEKEAEKKEEVPAMEKTAPRRDMIKTSVEISPRRDIRDKETSPEIEQLDSGEIKEGILEVL